MLKKQMKHKKGQQGFTLLEILVVVAIMAFLVAMVAPRFAGITDGTVDVVCDTNQQRMVAALSSYHEQERSLPSGMVNLVDESGVQTPAGIAATYFRPTHTGELILPDEGQATLFEDIFLRNQFQVHILNAAEASALRKLGVASVHNLNAYNHDGIVAANIPATTNEQAPLRRQAVNPGLGVLMIGMGAPDATAVVAGPAVRATAGLLEVVAGTPYAGWGNPDWLGRIILGVGPDSALITEGMITAAGLCPGGVNNEQVFWNNYNVVLPRLQETIARYPAMSSYMFAKANGGSYREFNLREAQPDFMFLTQCPEGHRYPTPDEFSEWAIYAAADNTPASATAAMTALEPFFP